MRCYFLIAVLLCSSLALPGQLVVNVSPLKVTNSKVIVPLTIQNSSGERVQSARAVVFLLDEQGKMVGQSTKWVIGGNQRDTGLAPGATNRFHFIITTDKRFASTNLTAKVSFTRIILASGQLADPSKYIIIEK